MLMPFLAVYSFSIRTTVRKQFVFVAECDPWIFLHLDAERDAGDSGTASLGGCSGTARRGAAAEATPAAKIPAAAESIVLERHTERRHCKGASDHQEDKGCVPPPRVRVNDRMDARSDGRQAGLTD